MKTYSLEGPSGARQCESFQLDVAYIGPRGIAKILVSVEGVDNIRKPERKQQADGVRLEFVYEGKEFVVLEPFGDNSRYWICPKEGQAEDHATIDIPPLREAFNRYRPSLLRRWIGNLLTFQFT